MARKTTICRKAMTPLILDNKNATNNDTESGEKVELKSKQELDEKLQDGGISQTVLTMDNEISNQSPNKTLVIESLNDSDGDYFEETHHECYDCNESRDSNTQDVAVDLPPQESFQYSPNPFEVRAKGDDSFEPLFKESMDNPLPDSEISSLVDAQSHQENQEMTKDCNFNSELTVDFTHNSNATEKKGAKNTMPYENLPVELVTEITERDKQIADLKEYIDLLLLRVMDNCPWVLLNPDPSTKN